MLSSVEFEFENHELTFLAVFKYETTEADFSDILIGIINANLSSSTNYSFDKKACKTKDFRLIETYTIGKINNQMKFETIQKMKNIVN